MSWNYKYKDLLKKAYKNLPKLSKTTERFNIPKIEGRFEGNRTVVSNINQIAKQLSREKSHIIRFLVKELATTGENKGKLYYFIGKFNSKRINEKIEKYTKDYVLCSQCNKPDTKLIRTKGINFKQCEACGARTSVRQIK